MSRLLRDRRAIGNVVFIGIVAMLSVALALVGVFAYLRIVSLQSDNSSLQTQINSLQSSNSQLQTNYQNLQSLYNQLQSSYNQLNSSYAQLNGQYQQLLSRLPAGGQGITIESIDSQPYSITPSGIYNVTLRNHGSSDIHVTALKLYYGAVLRSSASIFVTIPSNSAVTIHQYLAWDSLNYNSYTLKIETLEGYNATSDPLSSGWP